MTSRPTARSARAGRRQRGVATLIVVMVLFFIVSLVAAYTNRNLIFEQRTSVNQYRSSQALEAAEAGLEWATAMLNLGRIDTASCAPSTVATNTSFRERYIAIDETTGVLSPVNAEQRPSCVFNGERWNCACPATLVGTPAAPAATGILPAFRVRFLPPAVATTPGVIQVVVAACTRLDAACLADTSQGESSEGRVTVSALLALTGNLASPPVAALTVRGAVNVTGALQVFNANPKDSGITVQAGDSVGGASLVLHGAPGTPGEASKVAIDTTLSSIAGVGPFSQTDRMFTVPFNMAPGTFQKQPAAVQLVCAGASCSAADVRGAVDLNPGRPIWLDRGLTVEAGADIGTVDKPVLLVVNGDLTFTGPSVVIHGLVYVRALNWTTNGAGQVRGGVIADGNVIGAGTTAIAYDGEVLRKLRLTTGSLVRVPGSWRDFQ